MRLELKLGESRATIDQFDSAVVVQASHGRASVRICADSSQMDALVFKAVEYMKTGRIRGAINARMISFQWDDAEVTR